SSPRRAPTAIHTGRLSEEAAFAPVRFKDSARRALEFSLSRAVAIGKSSEVAPSVHLPAQRVYEQGVSRGDGDWLRVFEVPVPVPGGGGTGDRHVAALRASPRFLLRL